MTEHLPTETGGELDRLLAALAAGDAAFAVPFVERYGGAVARALRAAGAAEADVDHLVHDVALALVGAAPTVPGWVAVERAVAAVVGGAPPPPPGLGGRSGSGRGLHLVDIENLIGGPRADAWFATALAQYRVVAEVADGDQLVMAADRRLWQRTAFGVSGVRYVPARGPDGADRALLESAPAQWVVERFDRLVVGSGDHGFADLVAQVTAEGLPVVVVSRPASLSGRLRRAASEVRPLPDLPRGHDGSAFELAA